MPAGIGRRRLFGIGKPVVGGVEILKSRVAREVAAHCTPEESVLFCLRGDLNHSLIALEDRLLIVKPGFHAGTTFGSLVTTFFYRDVTGIQVHTYLFSGWIEVSSPSFEGGRRKYNRHPRTSDRDVYKLPSCVPIHKRKLAYYQPALTQLRECVRLAKGSPAAQPLPEAIRVTDRLVRLAELWDAGSITEHEYERVKQLLLDSARPVQAGQRFNS